MQVLRAALQERALLPAWLVQGHYPIFYSGTDPGGDGRESNTAGQTDKRSRCPGSGSAPGSRPLSSGVLTPGDDQAWPAAHTESAARVSAWALTSPVVLLDDANQRI